MSFFANNPGRLLYVECSAGIAGDMFLASLIDMADGEAHIRGELSKLALTGYEIDIFRDRRGGISGLRFEVRSGCGHGHRHLSDIIEIINESGISGRVKSESIRIFTLLAGAEGKVHGEPADHVHFHEVGAVDSIIDITGTMIMLEHLGWPGVLFSPLNVGSGTVECEHGILPVPAPATVELLKGLEIYSVGDPMERVTPTGAVFAKGLSGRTVPHIPGGSIRETGVGLGRREGALPNLLRTYLIDPADGAGRDRCMELAANIDDMTPQDLSFAMEKLFAAGALDVWFEHIQMKKNRPAVKLSCLGDISMAEVLARVMLEETTTLGVRQTPADRVILKRSGGDLDTALGKVRIKSAALGGNLEKQMPEFDDVRSIAIEHGIPIWKVRAIIAEEYSARGVYPEEPAEVQGTGHGHGNGHIHHH